MCLASLAAGCASENRKPDLPYPAFVETDNIEDMFMAALPGVRAKQYYSDMRTRVSSSRVDLPAEWSGTTGGMPGKSLEIYVLDGKLSFSDFELGAGGYAYVPPGSLGFRLKTESGARILYALDEVDESAVIRAPIIMDSNLVPWTEVRPGFYEKDLRFDPGNGARTWLQRLDPGVEIPLTSSSAAREGYLVSGELRHAECLDGEAMAAGYLPGGYFRRPPDMVHGGSESTTTAPSVWFLRERSGGKVTEHSACPPPVTESETESESDSRRDFGYK
jgi:hypothetical protein